MTDIQSNKIKKAEVAINGVNEDVDIDLIKFINDIWNNRKFFYFVIGISLFIGIVVAFLSPVKFRASASLLPSSDKGIGSLGSIGALAGMVGVNLNDMVGNETGIPSDIYPQIISSYPFLDEFMRMKYNFEDFEKPISVYEYIEGDTIRSFTDYVLDYTLLLPWTLKKVLFNTREDIAKDYKYDVINISEDDFDAIRKVKEMIHVDVNEKNGLVTVLVEADEPLATAQFTHNIVGLLQEYVIAYKTKKAREKYEFVKNQYEEKQQEYKKIQKAFFEYRDTHRNIDPNRIDIKYQLLSDEYEIITSVYKALAQQLEQAKITIKEETPVFSIINPEVVPVKKSKPNRMMIIFAFMFLGFIFGVLWLHLKSRKIIL